MIQQSVAAEPYHLHLIFLKDTIRATVHVDITIRDGSRHFHKGGPKKGGDTNHAITLKIWQNHASRLDIWIFHVSRLSA